MRPWRASDGIGGGTIYLPDDAARAAYDAACRDAITLSAAKHAISLPSLQQRREFVDSYPAKARDALKGQMKTLWEDK